VNESIGEFMGLITRAVGVEYEVKLSLDDQMWSCHVDPAQLQTGLLNLALNARDAMGESGLLTIETSNVTGMNGVELAREAKRINRAMKVLLTSGYVGDILERNVAAREKAYVSLTLA
jgi:signal transduction histidine kinase